MTAFRQWWQGRQTRERQVLSIGALAMLAMLLWALVWKPLADHRESLAGANQRLAGDLVMMRVSASELVGGGDRGEDAARARAGQSLLALADAGIREIGLSGSLRRIEPAGDGRVRIGLEGVPFDPVVQWLERLVAEQGIRIAELSAVRTAYAGQVDLQLLIEDP